MGPVEKKGGAPPKGEKIFFPKAGDFGGGHRKTDFPPPGVHPPKKVGKFGGVKPSLETLWGPSFLEFYGVF